MKNYIFVLTIFLSCSLQSTFSQQSNSNYDFDKAINIIKKDNLKESEKIKKWLSTSMTTNQESICTKICADYLADIPDDIVLGLEEIPGTLAKEFHKKWSSKFDMDRIPGVHPFELGNGGCGKSYARNIQYLGSVNNEYYFKTSIYCDNDKNASNKLILKIILKGQKYLIDNVMSQIKSDYFKY